MPRRWIPLTILGLLGAGLLGALVSISVGEQAPREIRLEETGEVQQLIAGIPQEDNRLGRDDAPVVVNLFIDIQCAGCADYMREVIDPIISGQVRDGELALVLRHRPAGLKPTTLAAFGTVAAGEQDRAWQYAQIFSRNLDKVPERGVDEEFLAEIAAVTPGLDGDAWQRAATGEEVQQRAQADDELAFDLGIPAGTALVVENPLTGESVTLEREPELATLLETIESVRA